MFLKVLFEVEDYQEIVRRTFSRVGHKLVSPEMSHPVPLHYQIFLTEMML